MYQRQLEDVLNKAAASFPVVFLTGPRQSGKTTLLKKLFPEHRYITLENPSTLALIQEDPEGFLSSKANKWIIDEAQNFPEIFSYIQGIVDQSPKLGSFLLSGSQNFLLHSKISQTLAGRAAVLELLPLTYQELSPHVGEMAQDIWSLIYQGGYPRPYFEKMDYSLWFSSYIRTYLERDIRSLINVRDLTQFQKFIKMCAHRHGQLLNLSSLAVDCGISQTTAREWLSYLETSYISFKVLPYFRNFNKRLVKTPKIYFYDSGILCHLLGIESPDHLRLHPMKGVVFEGFLISEILKSQINRGKQQNIYFWRDHHGLEVDAVIDHVDHVDLIEFKSSQTFHKEYLGSLEKVYQLADAQGHQYAKTLVYAGDISLEGQNRSVQGWRDFVVNL